MFIILTKSLLVEIYFFKYTDVWMVISPQRNGCRYMRKRGEMSDLVNDTKEKETEEKETDDRDYNSVSGGGEDGSRSEEDLTKDSPGDRKSVV